MSSLPTGIAGSVSQAALQQSQTARSADAARRKDEEHAARLRKLMEKHVAEVEDIEQVDPKQLQIKEHHPDDQQGRKRREQEDEVELSGGEAGDEQSGESKPAPPPDGNTLYRHLDVKA